MARSFGWRGALGSMAIMVAAGGASAQGPNPVHDLVQIRNFSIDRHEVTIGQYRAFYIATERDTKAEREGGGFQYLGGWQRMRGWTWSMPYGEPGSDTEPAVHITWSEAKTYCEWAGLRLPTDAEWVEAAYTERRPAPPKPFVTGKVYPFPTGDNADAANQIAAPVRLAFYPAPAAKLGQGRGHTQVGKTAPGVNGLLDMGGNVWEWVDHDVGGEKRTRGGSWWYGPAQMKADALYSKDREFPAVYIGFRCARS